ncbi:MAG: hypothetical protein PHS54_06170 [Clostridia bacterium]|nr:hypothetical protein [Clostridia bacterium]
MKKKTEYIKRGILGSGDDSVLIDEGRLIYPEETEKALCKLTGIKYKKPKKNKDKGFDR